MTKRSIFCCLLAASALLSCKALEEKLLYVPPIGKNTTAAFLSTVDGLTAAGEGMHRQVLEMYHDCFIRYAEIPADLLNDNTINLDEGDELLFNYKLESDHVATYPRNVWVAGWDIVTAANNIIVYADKLLPSTVSPKDRATLLKLCGQAYFCRALAHFDLCRAYAMPYNYTADHTHIGIPVVDRPLTLSDHPARAGVDQVYGLITGDLQKAMAQFDAALEADPTAPVQKDAVTDPYHIGYIAAQALLARVYLYMENWPEAYRLAGEVLGKTELTPREDYVNMFRDSQACPGRESIFRLNCYSVTFSLSKDFDPTRTYAFYPDETLEDRFPAGDVRADLLTYTGGVGDADADVGQSWPAVCKLVYYKKIDDPSRLCTDPFVLRASEMYLIHAEAAAHGAGTLAEAEADILALKGRAQGVDPSTLKLTYAGADGLLSLVAEERVLELCFEGHRFFDLARRGVSVVRSAKTHAENTDEHSALRLTWPNYRFILPIDRMEMQSNGEMRQNKGYVSYDGTYIDEEE